MANGSRIPHSLRIAVLLLRLALGLDFFYLGFAALFNPSLDRSLGARSLGGLHALIGTGASGGVAPTSLQTFFAWAFLVAGACLMLGLLLRFAAIAGIALTILGYWPAFIDATLGISRLANDEVLVIACLLVLVFANAGTYLGLDKFLHIHISPKRKS